MTPGRAHHHRRRGSVYVAVLGFATLLLVSAVAALLSARIERRVVALHSARGEARLLAMSAVDLALSEIQTHQPNGWRSRLVAKSDEAPTAVGKGTVDIDLYDAVDGDPSTGSDPFTVIGIGVAGDAEFRLALDFDAEGNRIEGTWRRWTAD